MRVHRWCCAHRVSRGRKSNSSNPLRCRSPWRICRWHVIRYGRRSAASEPAWSTSGWCNPRLGAGRPTLRLSNLRRSKKQRAGSRARASCPRLITTSCISRALTKFTSSSALCFLSLFLARARALPVDRHFNPIHLMAVCAYQTRTLHAASLPNPTLADTVPGTAWSRPPQTC